LFSSVQGLFWTVLASGGVALLTTYFLQHKLVYVPYFPEGARTQFMQPSQFGLTCEKPFFTTSDGETLQGWLFKTRENSHKQPTFLYFHGNAGNISFRLPNIKDIVEQLQCNVFIISYRGYGLSTGEPSEAGLKLDAEASLKYLLSRQDINSEKIIAFGRSLGGAVAIHLSSTYPEHICALIVENTFSSILDMVDVLFPVLSFFKPLCLNPWRSTDAISKVTQPSLFLAGEKDELVPPEMMQRLYQASPALHKVLHAFPKGDHMGTYACKGYYTVVRSFITRFIGCAP